MSLYRDGLLCGANENGNIVDINKAREAKRQKNFDKAVMYLIEAIRPQLQMQSRDAVTDIINSVVDYYRRFILTVNEIYGDALSLNGVDREAFFNGMYDDECVLKSLFPIPDQGSYIFANDLLVDPTQESDIDIRNTIFQLTGKNVPHSYSVDGSFEPPEKLALEDVFSPANGVALSEQQVEMYLVLLRTSLEEALSGLNI